MANDEMLSTNEAIKQELIELLNKDEILSCFEAVFHKYSMLSNKIVAIEFKFYDETQSKTCAPEEIKLLSAPLAPSFVQFGWTWCPPEECPPRGAWING
jgi:hypothetical protein